MWLLFHFISMLSFPHMFSSPTHPSILNINASFPALSLCQPCWLLHRIREAVLEALNCHWVLTWREVDCGDWKRFPFHGVEVDPVPQEAEQAVSGLGFHPHSLCWRGALVQHVLAVGRFFTKGSTHAWQRSDRRKGKRCHDSEHGHSDSAPRIVLLLVFHGYKLTLLFILF